MTTVKSLPPSCSTAVYRTVQCRQLPTENLGFSTLFPLNAGKSCRSQRSLALFYDRARLKAYTLKPIQAKNDSESSCSDNNSASFSGTFFFILFFQFQILFLFVGLKSFRDLESGIFNVFL